MKLSKKLKRIILAVIVFFMLIIAAPFFLIFLLNFGNPYEEYFINKYVPVYLENRGYTEKQIIEQHDINQNTSSNKDYFHTQYMVKFKDEPDIEYYYGVRKTNKEVTQFCERYSDVYRDIKQPTKHSEENCVKYYDNY